MRKTRKNRGGNPKKMPTPKKQNQTPNKTKKQNQTPTPMLPPPNCTKSAPDDGLNRLAQHVTGKYVPVFRLYGSVRCDLFIFNINKDPKIHIHIFNYDESTGDYWYAITAKNIKSKPLRLFNNDYKSVLTQMYNDMNETQNIPISHQSPTATSLTTSTLPLTTRPLKKEVKLKINNSVMTTKEVNEVNKLAKKLGPIFGETVFRPVESSNDVK